MLARLKCKNMRASKLFLLKMLLSGFSKEGVTSYLSLFNLELSKSLMLAVALSSPVFQIIQKFFKNKFLELKLLKIGLSNTGQFYAVH